MTAATSDWLRRRLGRSLEMSPEDIDTDVPLSAYGLDSSSGAALAREIGEAFGLEVPADLPVKEMSIDDVDSWVSAAHDEPTAGREDARWH